MCKQFAAVLYCMGARLDSQPELIFALRRVDPKDLVAQAGAGLRKSRGSPTAGRVLDANLADVFGIEIADVAPAKQSAVPRRQSTGMTKVQAKVATSAKPKVSIAGKIAADKKTVVSQGAAMAKAPAKSSASPRVLTNGKGICGITTAMAKDDAATTGSAFGRQAKKKSR
jgi:uncharacterized Zn finger protein